MGIIKEPNYTMYPNSILDDMGKLSHAEFKVLSAVIRMTMGYRRNKTPISLSKIQEKTGLSRQGVANAAKALESSPHDLIKRTQSKGKTTEWELVVEKNELVNSVDYSDVASQLSGLVDPPASQLGGLATNTRDLLKKKDIKKEDVIDFSSLPVSFSGNKEFTDTWNDWELHRKLIRHKLNPLIRKKQFKKLSSLPLKVAIYTLELAMEKGWTGYHVPKKDDPIWQEVEQESISDDDPWKLYKEGVEW